MAKDCPPRSGDNKASKAQPYPNVNPEAKLDPEGRPALGEMGLAPSWVFCSAGQRGAGRARKRQDQVSREFREPKPLRFACEG